MSDNQELAASQAAVTPLDTGWPTASTLTQGFLSGRWQRRDGNVYGTPAGRSIPGPNSAIRGGDDAQARVDVPSGAPRGAT